MNPGVSTSGAFKPSFLNFNNIQMKKQKVIIKVMLWLEFISAALILAKVFGIISWMWLLVLAPLFAFIILGTIILAVHVYFLNRYHDEN